MTSPSPKALPTFYLLLPLLVWMVGHSLCYKPVIVIHGLFDSSANFKNLLQYINESHPGTNVTVLDLFDNKESLQPLWKQVQGFKEAIYPIMQNAGRDGVHLLCYSQGGLICRGLLQTMPDHNVDTFISLSSPQMGQYGDTDYLRYLFPKYVKSNLYRLCYTQLGQTFSICNFWNDPHHHGIYVNVSDFLAPLNSERPEPNATDWKKNFLRLRKMVLIGGPDDGVITPWESRCTKMTRLDFAQWITEEQSLYILCQGLLTLCGIQTRQFSTTALKNGLLKTLWCIAAMIGLIHSKRMLYFWPLSAPPIYINRDVLHILVFYLPKPTNILALQTIQFSQSLSHSLFY
uniref:palmitoyl-CoA hydrolase n=1 Tax=Xenopus tropicalis TaxID=8364 RepID=A0A6I8QZJ3_XENTR